MSSEKTKAFILEAFDTLFNKRNYAKAAEYWSPGYIQHSAHITPGRDGLFDLVRAMPPTLRYENHLILAEGDNAMLHGKFVGHAGPRPWLAADRLRLEDGLLMEHWDVLADEPTKAESVSGLPAIGNAFASPDQAPTPRMSASALTVEEARAITAPLYEALNQPGKKDVAALLAQAALLHDVGKLGLSRALLRNPGALSADERALLVQPVNKGVSLLRALDVEDGVVEIVAAHHERWDGAGYPRGLTGEAISVEARILAIADSFDAMTSERVYHPARPREEAKNEIRREAGRQFEARLVDLFIALPDEAARTKG